MGGENYYSRKSLAKMSPRQEHDTTNDQQTKCKRIFFPYFFLRSVGKHIRIIQEQDSAASRIELMHARTLSYTRSARTQAHYQLTHACVYLAASCARIFAHGDRDTMPVYVSVGSMRAVCISTTIIYHDKDINIDASGYLPHR